MSCFRVSDFKTIEPLTVYEAVAEARSPQDATSALFWTLEEAKTFVRSVHAARVEQAEFNLRQAKECQADALHCLGEA